MKFTLKFAVGFFILINTLTIQSQPQSITVSFQANSYGEPTQLDSIRIVNRNKNCDTSIYYPNTSSFVLYYFTGLNSRAGLQKELNLLDLTPNPVTTGKAKFTVSLKSGKTITIYLTDVFGKIFIKKKLFLSAGNNLFDLILPEKGMFLLSVSDNKISVSKKIICKNSFYRNNAKIIFNKNITHANNYKNILQSNGWTYEIGDTLWYFAFAKTFQLYNGSDVIENSPDSDTTVTFSIVEGTPCGDTLAIKYEGKLYQTVEIKNRCWLKENLNIGVKINGDSTMKDNGIIEKYCYDNKDTNCDVYGGLYQWDELMQYTTQENAQGICPDGWHVPSIDEFNIMTNGYSADDFKEYGNSHWAAGGEGNNSLGLTVLPAGGRAYNSGTFNYITKDAPFYTSTKAVPPIWGVYYKEFGMGSITVWGNMHGTEGLAVRCIKDQ